MLKTVSFAAGLWYNQDIEKLLGLDLCTLEGGCAYG